MPRSPLTPGRPWPCACLTCDHPDPCEPIDADARQRGRKGRSEFAAERIPATDETAITVRHLSSNRKSTAPCHPHGRQSLPAHSHDLIRTDRVDFLGVGKSTFFENCAALGTPRVLDLGKNKKGLFRFVERDVKTTREFREGGVKPSGLVSPAPPRRIGLICSISLSANPGPLGEILWH